LILQDIVLTGENATLYLGAEGCTDGSEPGNYTFTQVSLDAGAKLVSTWYNISNVDTGITISANEIDVNEGSSITATGQV
jgi:hypothetical protein